jgi:hypothetical protein
MHGGSRSLLELVIVGLASGLLGAVVTALLRIRADREEQIRERMIVAADELVTGFGTLALDGRSSQVGRSRFVAVRGVSSLQPR